MICEYARIRGRNGQYIRGDDDREYKGQKKKKKKPRSLECLKHGKYLSGQPQIYRSERPLIFHLLYIHFVPAEKIHINVQARRLLRRASLATAFTLGHRFINISLSLSRSPSNKNSRQIFQPTSFERGIWR